MVTTTDLLQQVYEILVDLISARTSVSEPSNHVDVLDRIESIQTPFFGFEWTASANNRGMGGNRRPIEVEPNETDSSYDVTYAQDYTMSIDLAAISDGDSPRERTEHMSAIQSRFGEFIDAPENLHPDVNRVREQTITPSPAGDTLNTSARVTFEVDYARTQTDKLPLAEAVSFDVDVSDIDTYPEKY